MKSPDITAIVPVRAGSRRLKNKNLAPFAGTNLLLYKLEQLKRVASLRRVLVSSDSPQMLAFGAQAGALTHQRAPAYCDEQTKTFGEVVRHICESTEGEHILWATCTAPLVSPAIYERAIQQYFRALEEGFDSLMSVQVFRRYLWDDKGPVNYQLGLKHVPSQELPPLYFVTDGILLAPRAKMIEWSYFHGPNPYRFPLEKRTSVDIDDGLDLACARAWLDMDESVSQIEPFQVPNSPDLATSPEMTAAQPVRQDA